MPRVLLLIPSATYRAPDFMEAAGRLDVQVVVGSDQRQALEAIMPGRSLAVDMAHPERGAEQIAAFARRFPLDTIVPVDDGGTLVAALASERLGLPHNPFPAVQATRDKHLLRLRLAESGVPSPPYRLLDLDDDAQRLAAGLFYPCVVKPLALSGSRGVMRTHDAGEFAAASRRLRALPVQPDVAAARGPAALPALLQGSPRRGPRPSRHRRARCPGRALPPGSRDAAIRGRSPLTRARHCTCPPGGLTCDRAALRQRRGAR